MKKIILSENRLSALLVNEALNEYNISDGNADHNPYQKKIKSAQDTLRKFLAREGELMADITNGRIYTVYELVSLFNTIGVRYGLCRLIDEDDNEPYGSIQIRPMAKFKKLYI